MTFYANRAIVTQLVGVTRCKDCHSLVMDDDLSMVRIHNKKERELHVTTALFINI